MSVNNPNKSGDANHIKTGEKPIQNQIFDTDKIITPADDGINFDVYTEKRENTSNNDYRFRSSEITTKKNRIFTDNDDKKEQKIKDIKKIIKKQTLEIQPKYDAKDQNKKELKIRRKNRITQSFTGIEKIIWHGKRKIVTLFILLVIIPSAIIAPLIIDNIQKTEAKKKFATEVIEGESKSKALYNTINVMMTIDSNNYNECEKMYIDAINNATSNTEKMFLSTYYARFLVDLSSNYEEAVAVLEKVDINNTGMNARTSYYDALIKIYGPDNIDDEEKYNYYIKLRSEL